MAKTKIEKLREELIKLGVEFTPEDNVKTLEALLKASKAPKVSTGSTKVVWLKSRAYVSDSERVEAGLYVVSEVPERISKLDGATVEIFNDEVPSRKLAVIARWAGINPDGIDDDELFEKLASYSFKPF